MKRKKHDEIFPLGEDQDYNGIAYAVISWAEFRYGKMIAEYEALPWWKKLFRRNPDFVQGQEIRIWGLRRLRVSIRFMGMISFCVHGCMICVLNKSFLMFDLS